MVLGRVDIITEVSIMDSQIYMPREIHLEAVLHMFAFLRQKYNSRIKFEPKYPTVHMSAFK